ncbi:28S ribosomal protein S35, mitochondrial-like [Xenia sp. Carnegie-2017]|uniref:28S ribosomal protein S35, mitochondrial-like n=1 Tax=Xenia sp. Carnegie-2017 TaxID=2897299 RepID=UPI001F050559|nr:28S ribosomal protein S35, mitochondrial-like [Xenia sp. Carnegie-2017]
MIRPKAERMDIDSADWPSVYATASSYNSWLVPLPVRMGRRKHNKVGGLPNRDLGNIELLKIPNFFHLTPPAIKRHCEALKDLCTQWPGKEKVESRPLKIITRNYLFAGPSIRHPKSHIVQLKISLGHLTLDEHARKKMIELLGHRYNEETDELTITADKCPTRKQNRDYALYLLNVLYHESWKTEPWELENEDSNVEDDEVVAPRRSKRRRRKYKIIGNDLYRLNKYGKPFKMYIKQHGDRFPYDR